MSVAKISITRMPSHPICSGRVGAGPIGCAPARIGDIVVGVYNVTTLANASSGFEATISANGQLQQTMAGDASAAEFFVFLMPQS
jgi:hypothetical protein